MPRTFTFTVQSRLVNGACGTIDFFDLQAAIDIDGLNGISLIRDLKIGDKFEVELRDISVHSQDIYVSAIRRLDSPGQGDGGSIIPESLKQPPSLSENTEAENDEIAEDNMGPLVT